MTELRHKIQDSERLLKYKEEELIASKKETLIADKDTLQRYCEQLESNDTDLKNRLKNEKARYTELQKLYSHIKESKSKVEHENSELRAQLKIDSLVKIDDYTQKELATKLKKKKNQLREAKAKNEMLESEIKTIRDDDLTQSHLTCSLGLTYPSQENVTQMGENFLPDHSIHSLQDSKMSHAQSVKSNIPLQFSILQKSRFESRISELMKESKTKTDEITKLSKQLQKGSVVRESSNLEMMKSMEQQRLDSVNEAKSKQRKVESLECENQKLKHETQELKKIIEKEESDISSMRANEKKLKTNFSKRLETLEFTKKQLEGTIEQFNSKNELLVEALSQEDLSSPQ